MGRTSSSTARPVTPSMWTLTACLTRWVRHFGAMVVMRLNFFSVRVQGRTFEVAERVPFRLTQNIVDGFGITGVEGQASISTTRAILEVLMTLCRAGPFRRSCEISMRILRESQDSLMSVLEAFVHDPLVEWGKKRKVRLPRLISPREVSLKHGDNKGSSGVDDAATDEARKALVPIRRKLQGFQASSDPKNHSTYAVTIENHVQNLIQEATSLDNLVSLDDFARSLRSSLADLHEQQGSMYIGWASYM